MHAFLCRGSSTFYGARSASFQADFSKYTYALNEGPFYGRCYLGITCTRRYIYISTIVPLKSSQMIVREPNSVIKMNIQTLDVVSGPVYVPYVPVVLCLEVITR